MKRTVAILVAFTLLADGAAIVLSGMSSPLRPPVGGAGRGQGTFPVVLVAGFMSDGRGFAKLAATLEADRVPVLDFDPARPGTQPLRWQPSRGGHHITDVAAGALQPAIRGALARSGFDADTQKVDVVAHSVGGLLARALIELPGRDGIDPGWSDRIDDLVMVATPNHGSSFGSWLASTEHGSGWEGVAHDFKPRSAFLRRLGNLEPAGEVYTSIGGEAWPLNWARNDLDGDGTRHGHDGVVPAESPWVSGASLAVEPRSHGRLLGDRRVIDRIRDTLALR